VEEPVIKSTKASFQQPWTQCVSEKGFWIWKRPIYKLVYAYEFTFPYWFKFKIPSGIEFDKASVPHFGAIFGHLPSGCSDGASLIHDLLCRYDGKLPEGWYFEHDGEQFVVSHKRFTAKQIHGMYEYLCISGGMSPLKARCQRFFIEIYPKNWKLNRR
jgi:hypothetical protein